MRSFSNRLRDLAYSPLIFTGGGVKSAKIASFSTSLDFEQPEFEFETRYIDSETN